MKATRIRSLCGDTGGGSFVMMFSGAAWEAALSCQRAHTHRHNHRPMAVEIDVLRCSTSTRNYQPSCKDITAVAGRYCAAGMLYKDQRDTVETLVGCLLDSVDQDSRPPLCSRQEQPSALLL